MQLNQKKIYLRKQDILKLKNNAVIKGMHSSAKELDAGSYIVGGIVRNIISGQQIGYDYDFALTGKVKDAAERFAFIMNGSPFLLDKEAGSFRVVIKKDNISMNIDISPIKGRDIIEDIFARDFTINAMAVDLKELFEREKVLLIDPLNGAIDSKKRIIVPVKNDIFENDPIRLLRAVRLSAQYGFSIDTPAKELIRNKSHLLKTSSWERIRDEFFATIACNNFDRNLKKLQTLGLLYEIFPEVKDWDKIKDYDLFSHIIKTIREGESLLSDLRGFIPEYEDKISSHFNSVIGNITMSSLFKFTIFLHDIGKPITIKRDGERLKFTGHENAGEKIGKKIARRLKLSRKFSGILCRIIRNHHRVFNLASLEKVSFRSKAHFFRVMDSDGIELLLLSLADARATRGGEDPELAGLVKELIKFYFDVYSTKKPPPLLNGDEVMRIFEIPEGIMIGKILKKIQDAEGAGLIKNKKEAVEFIKRWLQKNPK